MQCGDSMSNHGAVIVPDLAMLAPHTVLADAVDQDVLCREHGGVKVSVSVIRRWGLSWFRLLTEREVAFACGGPRCLLQSKTGRLPKRCDKEQDDEEVAGTAGNHEEVPEGVEVANRGCRRSRRRFPRCSTSRR